MPLHIPLPGVQVYDYEGTNVVHRHDAEVSETGGPFTKKKEIEVGWLFGHDSIKVAFDLKSEFAGALYPVYGRLYVNDVEKGIVQSEGGTSYATKSETLSGINDNDKIQLYLHGWPGKNLIIIDSDTKKVYLQSGITSENVESFDTPYVWPTGVAFDGNDLISCDRNKDLIYVHEGISSSIRRSFNTHGNSTTDITMAGSDLIESNSLNERIIVHNGIAYEWRYYFDSPGAEPEGLTFDGTDLISSDSSTGRIYVHVGLTEEIRRSFPSPGGSYGLAFDGTDLISCRYVTNEIYVHDGITETIKDVFSGPGDDPTGLAVFDCLATSYARNLRIIGGIGPMAEKSMVFENIL